MNLYGKTTTIFLILASISFITSKHTLKWDIGCQFCFLSYFLIGRKIRDWAKNKKSNALAGILIIGGIIINIGLGYINYLRGSKGLPVNVTPFNQNPFSYDPLAPMEIVASCLVFAGFSVMKVNTDFHKLSGYTFLIYLIHMGIIDVATNIIGNRLLGIGNYGLELSVLIILSLGVFFVSLIIAIIYKRVSLILRSLIFRSFI